LITYVSYLNHLEPTISYFTYLKFGDLGQSSYKLDEKINLVMKLA